MRTRGTSGLWFSPLSAERELDSSIHSRTGRAEAAERSTHFQSSGFVGAFEGMRRSCSRVAYMDSSSTRTTVVKLGLTRTCFSRVGRNPARVTRKVYRPGTSLLPWKMPCVFVSRLCGAAAPKNSGASSTLAPICGVPAVSRTTPASLPRTGLACAAAGFATNGETAAVRTRAPRTRSRPCFTSFTSPVRCSRWS